MQNVREWEENETTKRPPPLNSWLSISLARSFFPCLFFSSRLPPPPIPLPLRWYLDVVLLYLPCLACACVPCTVALARGFVVSRCVVVLVWVYFVLVSRLPLSLSWGTTCAKMCCFSGLVLSWDYSGSCALVCVDDVLVHVLVCVWCGSL